MSAKVQPRFDPEALRDLAGDKVFERGKDYFRGGQVQLLSVKPARVLAQVAGTEDYRTELTGRGNVIDGRCSCPAFEDWGFCKHMVAAALAVNAVGDGEDEGALSRIRTYLGAKSVDALAEMIVVLAEHDLALFRKLDTAASLTKGDDKAIKANLRKAIDNATRTRGFIDYGEAASWAAGVDSVLDTLADLVPNGRADAALELSEHVLDRIDEAIVDIDDSDGHANGLLARARDIHLAAASAVKPDPLAFARDLFAREMSENFDAFDGAAALYADVLGDEGLTEYRRLAVESWQKLSNSSGKAREPDDDDLNLHQLELILDFFYEREGDVEARIALRAKDLSSPSRYLQLAEFCLSQGRHEEALRRAEEGLWIFEDDRLNASLAIFAADLLTQFDRRADASAHLWRAFEREPSLQLYQRLRELGGENARRRAAEFLEARLEGRKHRDFRAPSDLLVDILMDESMFDAAWAVIAKHGASIGTKEAIARATEATHAREALEVYTERVESMAKTGGNTAYAEAAKMIAHMARLQGASEQAAYVAALKERHGRKRSFMKLLA